MIKTFTTLAFCTAWIWLMYSHPVSENLWLAIALVGVFYGASCFALNRFARTVIHLNIFVLIVCTLTLVLLMFTAWATITPNIPLPALPRSSPRLFRVSMLFVPGFVSAITIATIFVYPLVVLLPRFYWLVPTLTTAMVILIEIPSLSDFPERPLARGLILYEWAGLLVLVPAIIKLLSPWVRGQRANTAVERALRDKAAQRPSP